MKTALFTDINHPSDMMSTYESEPGLSYMTFKFCKTFFPNQPASESAFVFSSCFDSKQKVGHRLTEVKYEAAVCRPASLQADRVSRKLLAEETLNTQVPV